MIAMIGTSDRLCWLAETCKILLLLLLSHSSCLQNCDCFSTAEALKALRAPFVLVLMLKSEVPLDFANGLSLELWAQIMSLLVSGVPEENVMRCFSAERIFSQQANFTA